MRPIQTNDLSEVVDQKNYEFIKEFEIESEDFLSLLKASEFLVCNSLKRLLAAKVACKIYFKDTRESYEAKKKELGIVEDITFDEEEHFRSTILFDEISK